jgi:hypothetical protein
MLKKKEKEDAVISAFFYPTKGELEEIKAKAKRFGVSLSRFVILRSLDKI